jgi:hypothetical protein
MKNFAFVFFFFSATVLSQSMPPILDKAGNEIPPDKLEYAGYVPFDSVRSNICFLFFIDKKIGFYDFWGHEVIPPTFDRAEVINFSHKQSVIKVTSEVDSGVFKVGVMDLQGNIIVPQIYSLIEPMGDGTTFQRISTSEENQGVLLEYSKVVIPAQYLEINDVDGLGRTVFNVVDKKNNVALVDSLGRTILPFGLSSYDVYPDENSPEEGPVYYQFFDRKKYGYASTEKGIIIPALYEYTESLKLGRKIYFSLEKGKKNGMADGEGKWIIPLEYSYIDYEEFFGKAYFIVKQKKKFGIFDETGKQIVPVEYKSIDALGESDANGIFTLTDGAGQTFFLTHELKLVKGKE